MKPHAALLTNDEAPAMRINIIRTLLAALLLTALAGCGSLPLGKSDRAIVLEAALNNYRKLIRWARYYVFGAFLVAAVLTPPDAASQIAMAIPACALYALSIGLVYLLQKKEVVAAEIEEEKAEKEAAAEKEREEAEAKKKKR